MRMIELSSKDLVMPYFVVEGRNKKEPVKNMPDIARFSVDNLLKDVKEARKQGIDKVLLFGVCPPRQKNERGSYAYAKDSIVAKAITGLKREIKGVSVFTDVCLCAYTSHGHCGIITSRVTRHPSHVDIDNGKTLEALAKIALSYAEAGADWVAPSAMAKRQVTTIRKALDKHSLKNTKILGYSAKFVSNFYGPFRNAADSAPRFGNRRNYQLDYASREVALREVADDIKEGANMVMVKPALSYLDVIREVKSKFRFPLAAYNVSGEYAMVKYGANLGLWKEKKTVLEILTSIKRAGADLIISYHAKDVAKWLKEKD